MVILRMVLALVMILARVIPFLLVAALLVLLWRRSARKRQGPDFQGPVVTVDYEIVEDGEEKEE